MFEKMRTSWALTTQSWSVLREQKSLVVFPLISSALTMLVVCTFLLPPIVFFAMSAGGYLDKSGGSDPAKVELWQRALMWLAMFVCYFLASVVVTFFNSALVACAMQHFAGEVTSPRRGLDIALSRWKQIIAWSLVNATVGVVLQMLKENVGWLGRLVLGATGVAWTIATFFVVPVLVVEGVGPIEAVKRSTDVLKKTWGESLIMQFGVGTVMGLFGFLVFLVCTGVGVAIAFAMQSPIPGFVGAGVGILGAILIGLISSVLKTILVAACYQYASQGRIPTEFDGGLLRQVVGVKR